MKEAPNVMSEVVKPGTVLFDSVYPASEPPLANVSPEKSNPLKVALE